MTMPINPVEPNNIIETEGTVTTEHTPAAAEAEMVYLSITFPEISKDVAANIVEVARAAAGQVSFSVYYDKATNVNDTQEDSSA